MEVGGEVAYISIPPFGCPRAHILTPTAIAGGGAKKPAARLATTGAVGIRRFADSHPPQICWTEIHSVPMTFVSYLCYIVSGDGGPTALHNQTHCIPSLAILDQHASLPEYLG